jgi:hypothetical protein
MEPSEIISQLHANQETFNGLLRGAPAVLQHWRPHAEHWCLLEISCHLYDEEREDFRARVRSVLEDPSQALASIDPQAWVSERRYLEQDFMSKLDAFIAEREASIAWLKELEHPNWEQAYQHPTHGPLPAKMFLSNWLAHDYLHIRQITRVKYHYLQAHAGVPLDYAGSW